MNMLAPRPVTAPDALVPVETPLKMPVRSLQYPGAPRAPLAPPEVRRRRWTVAVVTLAVVVGLGWLMATALLRDGFAAGDAVMLGLYLPNIAWTGFAAATALGGYFWQRRGAGARAAPHGWRPRGRTAVLIPARNEDVAGLAARIAALRADLAQLGFWRSIDIFVLSDSDNRRVIAAEEAMMARFAGGFPVGPRVYYRRRLSNAQRKPGNIAEWVQRWGGAYAYMLMLDADSRMSARRIGGLIHRMETHPHLGLIQTGIRLTGAESRFARLQQLATRLYGPAFAAGIAGWSGAAGNYWGHNALVRVRAFAGAAGLPRLRGRTPFGGDILSHDFVEAAWLRRAGWGVEIDPDSRGSAEGGPETLAAYHKRDRRWCQGNLQHARVLTARGLHPASRTHMICGIAGYMAAPFWLALVAGAALVGPTGGAVLPFLGALGLILVQKLAGVLLWMQRRPGARGRLLRLALGELVVSALLAPVIMVRQTVAVASVLSGNDCGWKPAAGARRQGADDMPWLEPAVGLSLLLGVLPGTGDLGQLAFVAPIVLPLLAAPLIVQWLDLPPGGLPAWMTPARAPEPAAVPVRQ
jgi:membrane glycosyltransferase